MDLRRHDVDAAVAARQPLLVYGGSAAFDSHINAVILFGGGSGGIDQDTTWRWSGSNWTQVLTTQSPPPREGAGIAYDPPVSHIIIFGGQIGGRQRNDNFGIRT